MDGIVILCALILNPLARRRRKREAAAASSAEPVPQVAGSNNEMHETPGPLSTADQTFTEKKNDIDIEQGPA